ncbi:MAG: 3-isopropylmalate dehydratase small subunit [Dehalococcoidia bacterium]|nr:3-isopropylmalate dehydratase small subunit [Dehalococcoidia bacterium]
MKSINTIQSIVLPLNRADVDTDQIMPKQYLKRIERSGYGPFTFDEWRKDPKFVLNNPLFQKAEILLAQRNFGSGSSREHAVWGLEDIGVRVVIAPSFADIFNSNCGKVGILCIQLEQEIVNELMSLAESDTGLELSINLEKQTILNENNNIKINFTIDNFLKHRLQNGLDEIGMTMQKEDSIKAFEETRSKIYPSTKSII